MQSQAIAYKRTPFRNGVLFICVVSRYTNLQHLNWLRSSDEAALQCIEAKAPATQRRIFLKR